MSGSASIYFTPPRIFPSSVRYRNARPMGKCHEFQTGNNSTDGVTEVFFLPCSGNVCNICRPTVWNRLLRDDGGVQLAG